MFSNPYAHAEGLDRFSPIKPFQYLIWSGLAFLETWIRSRRLTDLFLGIPAILCLGGLLIFDYEAGQPLPLDSRQQYLNSAQRTIDSALAAEDPEIRSRLWDQAEFYMRKLDQQGFVNEEFLWQRARLDAQRGRSQRRWDDLNAILIDHEQPRDIDAHHALALGLLTGEWEREGAGRLAEEHLQKAIAIEPNSPRTLESKRLLVEVYLSTGRVMEARPYLEEVARHYPDYRVRLARVYENLNDIERMKSVAAAARDYHRNRLQEPEIDELGHRLALAEAHVMLREFEDAVAVLYEGMTRLDNPEPLRTPLARVYVQWAVVVRQQAPDDLERQLALLEQALLIMPADPYALYLLTNLAISLDGPQGEQVNARLSEIIATGQATFVVHTLLGTHAAAQGEGDLARFHLQQAYEQGLVAPELLNNLAYVLAFSSTHDYETALKLCDEALEMRPLPQILETRGQILARLERWPEAITALEAALRGGMRDYPPIHQTLAEAYAAVGQESVARVHREKLEALGGPVVLDLTGSQADQPSLSTEEGASEPTGESEAAEGIAVPDATSTEVEPMTEPSVDEPGSESVPATPEDSTSPDESDSAVPAGNVP